MNSFLKTTLILLSFFMIECVAETYVWTDDTGKKFYGDTVPPEFKERAKKLDLKPLNTVAPEDGVRQQNKTAVEKLRREDAQNNIQKRQRSQPINPEAGQSEPTITLESCRDQPHLTVKQRTECLRSANKQAQAK